MLLVEKYLFIKEEQRQNLRLIEVLLGLKIPFVSYWIHDSSVSREASVEGTREFFST